MSRRIHVSTYLSLDGIMEAPHEWSLDFFDEGAAKYANEQLFASEGLLLGRVTYEGFAAAWPARSKDDPFTERINTMPKHVVTSSSQPLAWENSHALAIEDVQELKESEGGDLLIYGSGRLTLALLDQGLIDELRLWIHPVVVGRGLRLFPEGTAHTRLKLLDSRTLDSGVTILALSA